MWRSGRGSPGRLSNCFFRESISSLSVFPALLSLGSERCAPLIEKKGGCLCGQLDVPRKPRHGWLNPKHPRKAPCTGGGRTATRGRANYGTR